MAVVKINALEIPPQAGEEIVKRFSARLDELSRVEGFQGFELLRPTGDAESRWFVYTRWADEEAYQAWRTSDVFARGHAAPGGPPSSSGQSGHPGGHPGAEAGGHPGGQPGAEAGGHPGDQQPVAMGATLLEFEVAVSADPAGS
ncbi:MAG: antibiotic biosynthesis monooxygenase family protein [Acidimicrobiales bacterium]